MKNELYFSAGVRRDGSLDTDKSCFWRTFLREALAFILMAVFLIGITLFVLIDPFNIGAPNPQDTHLRTESPKNAF